MMRFRRLSVCLFLAVSIAASGQYTKEFKRIFFDADFLYQTGFYDDAFNRYKNLLTLDPGNSNILFRCGACCLNIPGSEEQAITYLSEAVEGVTPDYKDKSHKESGSPVLAYYMLGRAYHLHNDFDKARENYQLYIDQGIEEDPLQIDYAALQIEACSRAEKQLTGAPSFEFQDVLDHFDDDLPSCNNPVVSGDGNILIFLVDYPDDKKIMMTRKEGKLWTRPRVINSEIGMVGETVPASLSYDGNDLYLVHQYYSHSDVYISHFDGNRWTQAEALNHQINGRTDETHASISKDGNTLYFTSDRRGGVGSFDIYVTERDEGGEWGPARNLGEVINTAYEEHTPFISSNDSILFFSSQGHGSIGGIDVYYSEIQEDGSWGEPINLGSPVNTTGENIFFNPGWDELDGFYAVRRQDDPTSNTINMVIELEPEERLAKLAELTAEREAESDPEPEEEDAEPGDVAENQVIAEVEEIGEQEPDPPEEAEEIKIDLEKAIEPPETEEIYEILNKGNLEDETQESAETTPPNLENPPVEIQRTSYDPPMGSTTIETAIPFGLNGFELDFSARLTVERIAELMHQKPESRIELTGHTDGTGDSDYNMLLSFQRANQIADYLKLRGIHEDRIHVEGKGEDAPVARNNYSDGGDSPFGRFLNRQVHIRITDNEPLPGQFAELYVPQHLQYVAPEEESRITKSYWFTIQVKASNTMLNSSHFENLIHVDQHTCKDGYYRYSTGKFTRFEQATAQVKKLVDLGYKGAYIQTIDYYDKNCE